MEVEVYDGLDSTDGAMALSARQGNILYNMIVNVATESDIDAIFE